VKSPRVLLLNYHGTSTVAAGEDIHTLRQEVFDSQMQAIADSGLQVMHFSDLVSGRTPRTDPGLVITFDDGLSSDLTNARQLAARGWSAVFFMPTARIGRLGHLNWDQVRELVSLGMTIGSHSHDHVMMSHMPSDEAQRQLERSRQLLHDELGIDAQLLAFPGGGHTPALVALARQMGFRYLFGTRWGLYRDPAHEVLCRNNVVTTMDLSYFDALIRLRNLGRRRLAFSAVHLLKQSLGESGYGQLRAWSLALVRRPKRWP